MVFKNNKDFYLRKSAKKVSKYAIKRLSVGVASVLLSTAFFLGHASADTTTVESQDVKTELSVSNENPESVPDTNEVASDEATTEEDASTETANDSSSSTTPAATDSEEATKEASTEDTTATTTELNKQEATAIVNNQEKPESTEDTATTKTASVFRRANVDTSLRAAAADTSATEGVTVNNWSALVSAMRNANNQVININGVISASSDGYW